MKLESLVDKEYPSLKELYLNLHTHPELSYFEQASSKRMADELRRAGFEVSEQVGKYPDPKLTSYGVVGVMNNGAGPTILVRTDMDALPVQEKTGLPYASKITMRNQENQEVPVMHACGHDIHMSVFVGTARALSAMKDQWKGTLVMIAQPSEELGQGALAMLDDGLFTRFPKPDYCIALHDDAGLDTGKVGWIEGYTMANVDSVDITIQGVGGHGAYPHKTKDPIVIAAETILALQTIVSREIEPGEPAVITVGSIHGGTKHNIIPDDVKLQLTVRSYKKEIREHLLAAIERVTKGIAQAAGVPADRMPVITREDEKFTPAVFNNAALVRRIVPVFQKEFGESNVVQRVPVMGGEDFSRYALDDGSIPIALFWLGAVDPAKIKSGEPLPSLHSALFAPVPEPTIKTGVKAMTVAVLDLMKK